MSPSTQWKPVESRERYSALDLLRGFALFGVLLINLLYFFRVSLWAHILSFHSEPGRINHAVDILAAGIVEFKAFHCFAFTFGIGMAIQAERASLRGREPELFLVRRLLVLLAIGAIHMVMISNVDILMLYAVLGLMMTFFLRLPTALLAVLGVAAIYFPSLLHFWTFPNETALRDWAVTATRYYSHGNYLEILAFRWAETRELIVPVLMGTAQSTLGFMLLGSAAWRLGIVREPQRWRTRLWFLTAIAGSIALVNTADEILTRIGSAALPLPNLIRVPGSDTPLALAYIACLLALVGEAKLNSLGGAFAAAGQMALTNYLTQSVIFACVFYGYGLGWFGRIETAPAAIAGVVFYAIQVAFSQWWLRRYRFGPLEWIWRSATYGARQPMRRVTASL